MFAEDSSYRPTLASAGPNTKTKMELAWTHVKWWQHHQTGATVDTTRPQRKRATKKYFDKRSGERNVDTKIQVQLEKDGGGSTRQRWMETTGLWPMFYWERQGIRQVSQRKSNCDSLHAKLQDFPLFNSLGFVQGVFRAACA